MTWILQRNQDIIILINQFAGTQNRHDSDSRLKHHIERMPRISRQPRKTALGAFVRRERLARGKTQREFEQLLGIEATHKLYVSKVETGAILQPGEVFLEALAHLTGRPRAEINAMAKGEGEDRGAGALNQRGLAPFKVAFGHCLWAAPLVLARDEDEHLPFHFASARDDIEELYTKDQWGNRHYQLTEYFSAVQVKERLLKANVELAGLPGDLIKAESKDILSIASLVDSSISCTLLLKQELTGVDADQIRDGANLKVDEFLRKLLFQKDGTTCRDRVSGSDPSFPFHLGVMYGTIAQEMLISGIDLLPIDIRKRVGRHLPKRITSEFFRDSAEAKKFWAEPSTIGVLVWEPQATWLQESKGVAEVVANKQGWKPVKVKLFFPLGKDGRPRHLSYELAMLKSTAVSEDVRHRELRASLSSLIDALDRHADFLNQLDDDTPMPPEDKLKVISDYFELGRTGQAQHSDSLFPYEQALHAIGEIRYSVKWNPEAIELMQFRPQL